MSVSGALDAFKENKNGISTLVASFIGLLLSLPVVFMTVTSTLMVPITEGTGWSRGDVSNLIALSFVGQALGSAIFGRVLATRDPRRVIALSTLVLGGSMIGFGLSQSYILAVLFAISLGGLGAAAGLIGYVAVLPLWFDRRLGTALGVAMLGLGGGAVIAPVLAELLVRTFDWREVYMLIGVVILGVALPGALFLVKVPAEGFLTKQKASDGDAPAAEQSVEMSQVLRDRRFWQIALLFFIATAAIAGTASNLPALMTDKGYDPATAAWIFTIWGFGITLSRFVSGVLLDLMDSRLAGAIFMTGAAVGFGILITDPSVFGGVEAALAIIVIAAFCIASAQGMDGDLLPYIIRRCFGLKAYSTAFGLATFAYYLGATLGIGLFGFTYETTGNYDLALQASCIALIVSCLMLITLGKPEVRGAQLKAES